jgi:hypothetical protein
MNGRSAMSIRRFTLGLRSEFIKSKRNGAGRATENFSPEFFKN